MMRKAQMMSENMPADKASEEALERLLVNVKRKMAWHEVKLPSRGLLYQGGETSVKIRPFTFEEERLLKSETSTKDPEGVIDKLIAACTQGIETSQLTPHDRLYVLFRLRGISYGDQYPINHDCVNCGATSKLDLSINSLVCTELKPEDMVFTLPDSGMEVEIKLPRSSDAPLYRSNELVMQNMHMFIRRIGDVADKTIIEAFVRKTTVKDIDTLRNAIFAPEYGMENHFFYGCRDCGHKNRVEILLNENFFTAS